ncbi:NUDIX hydrolase [Streptomyces sp. NPDC056190]|uniref:NUDIX hydrolase n=1 Tax=Streptomyces sp. NPDC056190 TaxID=3345741 RepID=UPI0035D56ABB
MISNAHIRETAEAYLREHPEASDELAPLFGLLGQDAQLASRKEFRGHVTAGAILADAEGRILFIEHVALGRWLTPGGHLENEDEELMQAALRELAEETGIRQQDVVPLLEVPVHIDVHTIPDSPVKGEPEHEHIDFRFLFTTGVDVAQLQAEEVSGFAWFEADLLSRGGLQENVQRALKDRA